MTNLRRKEESSQVDGLVHNAVDFMTWSVDELQERPKNSLIAFCTAIELLLKARLLMEHWALIFEDPSKAHWKNFGVGDFKSVAMKDLIPRLESLGRIRLTKAQKDGFQRLVQHRNKLIHFYDSRYGPVTDASAIEEIAAEQCRVWFLMHELLTEEWKPQFKRYQLQIEELHDSLHHVKRFLQVKFDRIRPKIEEEEGQGTEFFDCLACGFHASKTMQELGLLFKLECLVCLLNTRFLFVVCHNCEKTTPLPPFVGGRVCLYCSKEIKLDQLVDDYATKTAHGEKGRAYCQQVPDCLDQDDSEQTAILIGDRWLCLRCLNVDENSFHCCECQRLFVGLNPHVPEVEVCMRCYEEDWPSTTGGVM